MIRPGLPLQTRYVDYGKVFVPNGALDFSSLACSDAELAQFGPQLFNRGLLFPETSPFAAQVGGVSAALLRYDTGYLFTLVQRRREGELSAPGAARTDRPFNQVRFVILTREMIEQAFAARASLYTSLALAARHPDALGWLKDYTANAEPQPWNPVLDRIEPDSPDREAVRYVTNAIVAAAAEAARQAAPVGTGARAAPPEPAPISVPLPGVGLLEKLRLVEAVQHWVLPRLGVLSFALDYVTIQNVHLRLFALPPDAPAPLPAERVFVYDGQPDPRLAADYYSAVSSLAASGDALADAALPDLLRLRLPPAEAARLYTIEKQGLPLSGVEALRLYPELARLGERRFSLLRRVPRDDQLALLRRDDLPADLRLDLLQVAFDAGHGLLAAYAPAHLAVPRPARDDERIRARLRQSLSLSPEASLALVDSGDLAELFRDLLSVRNAPAADGQRRTRDARRPAAGGAQAGDGAPLAFAAGQPLLQALLLRHRTPPLATALAEVSTDDARLFGEALAVIDAATDLRAMLWLWRSAGQGNFAHCCAGLERAVQPAWYSELRRDAAAWRELLEAGRTLAANVAGPRPESAAELADQTGIGALLRALPASLVPFVWQASLATAEHDAAFAEWWLFSEALALPDQLPALWEAIERLPAGALPVAGPKLNYLLGRAEGLSLLDACTPPDEAAPGASAPNEALFATVLRAWLAAGFRSPAGNLALATEDVAFLIAHLPGSNDILAAIAAAPAQAKAIAGLAAGEALRWARAARGSMREPYHQDGHDLLFRRLIELPAADEALLWHLLVEDDGTRDTAMAWSDYAALAHRIRGQAAARRVSPRSPLRAYLDVVASVQSGAMAETFRDNQMDLRAVLAKLAGQWRADAAVEVLPLAVFHVQETNPSLRERSADLLRAVLQRPDVTTQLQALPDNVLAYLRQHLCNPAQAGPAALAATGRWIDGELARRRRSYRVETPKGAPRPAPARARSEAALPSIEGTAPAVLPTIRPITPPAVGHAGGPVPPPAMSDAGGAAILPADSAPAASEAAHGGVPMAAFPLVEPPALSAPGAPEPFLVRPGELVPLAGGQVVLPGSAATVRAQHRDTAAWLWIAIVVLVVLACVTVIAALAWVQSLQAAAAPAAVILARLRI